MTKDQNAPGALNLVRAFVNSINLETGKDEFETPAAAGAWLEEHDLPASVEAGDLASLRDLREAIRTVLLAHSGDAVVEPAWRRLSELIAGAPVHIELQPGETARLAARCDGAAFVLKARLAILIYDAIRDGKWSRLKACRKHSCLWAFYDHSKNGSGAWCSMAVCGNRAKAQRRRQRQSA